MSKLFYDHLIIFEEIEAKLSSYDFSSQEKEEIHQIIEETVHLRVMTRILDRLPREHHNQFLELFHKAPYHQGLLTFLKDRVENIEGLIQEEISALKKELLEDVKVLKSPPKSSKKA